MCNPKTTTANYNTQMTLPSFLPISSPFSSHEFGSLKISSASC